MTKNFTQNYKLYSSPTFLEGVASLVDITNSLQSYNLSDTEEEADSKALKSDWQAVGLDVNNALVQDVSKNVILELEQTK